MFGLETRWTGVLCPGGDESLTSMTADRQQREVAFRTCLLTMDPLQGEVEGVEEVSLIHRLISTQQHNPAEDVSVYSIC